MIETITNKTELQKDFLNKVKNVYNECIGFQDFGSSTEFFDESGVILMVTTQKEDGSIEFDFGDKKFDYKEKNKSQNQNTNKNLLKLSK